MRPLVVGRRLVSGALLAVCLSLALAGCGSEGPPRPDLVFVSTRDGDYALFAMDADGSRETRLTPAPSSDEPRSLYFQIEPAWSPDGRWIAFASRRGASFDLYAMRADGTGTRRLTATRENDGHPAWSPDGSQIVFQRGDPPRLFLMDADGSRQRRLTNDLASEAQPAWSPDGAWIAYVRRTPGTEIRELWLMRPNGSARRRLTRLGAVVDGPAWSPDGRTIAFASNVRASRFDVYVVGVDGRGLRRLTTATEAAFEPAWSPDGRLLAFSQDGAIAVRPLLGGETRRLTDPDDNDSSPVWNPVPPPAEEDG
ncbi:MAG: hypothetical protein RMM28_00820 [Thermoleophilia bacterium]|nr:hypothetical protein [Gaiellaceae bacterium]MDW8337665.1 hypothetical protein [Thermoleophilia bacterium]